MSDTGLLLLNLGSPESARTSDVRRYLNEFLTDPYVIDLPAVLRYALVYGVITPLRARKSAKAYASIWTSKGSPLTNFTRDFATAVAKLLQGEVGWDVRWAMRYGNPSCASVLRGWKVKSLYVVPLYPQYAESSTRSAVEKALQEVRRHKVADEIYVLQDFYGEQEFIDAQVTQINKHLESFNPEQLVLSFHGLPEHHLSKLHDAHCLVNSTCCETVTEKNRYCYRAQSFFTASAIRAHLSVLGAKTKISFQSRLGRRPWIKPYTDHLIAELAAQGIKRVLVSSPSFVADCLETLEEIQIRLREQFIKAGGTELHLVPALNAEEHWVRGFCKMIRRSDLRWQNAGSTGPFIGF